MCQRVTPRPNSFAIHGRGMRPCEPHYHLPVGPFPSCTTSLTHHSLKRRTQEDHYTRHCHHAWLRPTRPPSVNCSSRPVLNPHSSQLGARPPIPYRLLDPPSRSFQAKTAQTTPASDRRTGVQSPSNHMTSGDGLSPDAKGWKDALDRTGYSDMTVVTVTVNTWRYAPRFRPTSPPSPFPCLPAGETETEAEGPQRLQA